MKQTTLRLPDELFDALVKEAEAEDRSLNSVIQRRLRWVRPEILDAIDDGERVTLKAPQVRGPLNLTPVTVDPDAPPGDVYLMNRVPSEAEIEKEFNETLRWAAREFKEPETGGPINHVP